MIYTLNLFDIRTGKIELYREYSLEAGRVISSLNGKPICSGWHSKTLRGNEFREYFIVVEFPSQEALDSFLYDPRNAKMHKLREVSTENYIWKVFEPWNLDLWVAFKGLRKE